MILGAVGMDLLVFNTPRLAKTRLPKDHLARLAISPAMRRSSIKLQTEYMTYRRAMIERNSEPMGFSDWRKS